MYKTILLNLVCTVAKLLTANLSKTGEYCSNGKKYFYNVDLMKKVAKKKMLVLLSVYSYLNNINILD